MTSVPPVKLFGRRNQLFLEVFSGESCGSSGCKGGDDSVKNKLLVILVYLYFDRCWPGDENDRVQCSVSRNLLQELNDAIADHMILIEAALKKESSDAIKIVSENCLFEVLVRTSGAKESIMTLLFDQKLQKQAPFFLDVWCKRREETC